MLCDAESSLAPTKGLSESRKSGHGFDSVILQGMECGHIFSERVFQLFFWPGVQIEKALAGLKNMDFGTDFDF